MRKLPLFFAFLLLITIMQSGCSEKKTPATDSIADSDTVDTVDTVAPLDSDTVVLDTLSSIIAATPMPKAADELFDDFLFNFAANNKLQHERVAFPLPVIADNDSSFIEEKQWHMQQFFMPQGYYTLIFDNEKQMELMKDTHISHAVVEKINLDGKNVEQFVFERKNGLWTLTNIRRGALYQNANASFLDFYERFSRDSLFQVASLAQPVKTSLPDPDDDFSYIDGEFYPEQWTDFKPPVMPQHMIYNILYGQEYKQSNKKLFIIRGIANGLETEMTFQMKGGEWKLTQLSN